MIKTKVVWAGFPGYNLPEIGIKLHIYLQQYPEIIVYPKFITDRQLRDAS